MPKPFRFLVLDTESSVCRVSHERILVSLAYEVVVADAGALTVVHSQYDVVELGSHRRPDAASERVHGITAAKRKGGRPLSSVLCDLSRTLQKHAPQAVVGHDIAGDTVLLVSEAVRTGLAVEDCRPLFHYFRRLICTKHLTRPFYEQK